MALIPIPNDWDGLEWCCRIVEWPASVQWQAIFLGQITAPLRGRFWDGRTGSIIGAQDVGEQIFLRNLGDDSMTCFDELATSIEYLADRLYNKPCCPSMAGSLEIVGVGPGGAASVDEPETTLSDNGEDPPSGSGTYNEYRAYKCAVATWVLDQWKQDLSNTRLINWVAGFTLPEIVALLVATLVTPIPGDEVVVLSGAFFYLLTQGIISPVLEMIEDELEANESDLICALYEAQTVEGARQDVGAILAAAYEAGYSAVYAFGGNLLTMPWLRNANLNKVFEIDDTREYPAGDCSSCNEAVTQLGLLTVDTGTEISRTYEDNDTKVTIRAQTEYVSAEDHEIVQVSIDQAVYPDTCFWYDTDNFTLVSGPACSRSGKIRFCNGTEVNITLNLESFEVEYIRYIQPTTCSPGTSVYDLVFYASDPNA